MSHSRGFLDNSRAYGCIPSLFFFIRQSLCGLQIPLKKINKLNELLKPGVILRTGAINFFKWFGL